MKYDHRSNGKPIGSLYGRGSGESSRCGHVFERSEVTTFVLHVFDNCIDECKRMIVVVGNTMGMHQ